MPTRPPTESLPALDYLGSGSLNHIFGHDDWVLKVRRWNLLGIASRAFLSPRWLARAERTLGGCLLPSAKTGRIRFVAPRVGSGGTTCYRVRAARIVPRLPPDDFLDHRLAGADAGETVRLLGAMLDVLELAAARGFHLADFIMSNFAFYNGALVIADPDLLVPRHFLRWSPTCIVTAWQFRIHLGRDYDRLLVAKSSGATPDAGNAIARFRSELPRRLRALTTPPLRERLDPPQPARLPERLVRSATRVLNARIDQP